MLTFVIFSITNRNSNVKNINSPSPSLVSVCFVCCFRKLVKITHSIKTSSCSFDLVLAPLSKNVFQSVVQVLFHISSIVCVLFWDLCCFLFSTFWAFIKISNTAMQMTFRYISLLSSKMFSSSRCCTRTLALLKGWMVSFIQPNEETSLMCPWQICAYGHGNSGSSHQAVPCSELKVIIYAFISSYLD